MHVALVKSNTSLYPGETFFLGATNKKKTSVEDE